MTLKNYINILQWLGISLALCQGLAGPKVLDESNVKVILSQMGLNQRFCVMHCYITMCKALNSLQ